MGFAPGASVTVQDVWTGESMGTVTDTWTVSNLESYDSLFYIFKSTA